MPSPPQILTGTVISAGRMTKAVKVRTTKQIYNSFLRKHYTAHQTHHVSDPNSSLRMGDVVRIAAAHWRSPGMSIRHVVTEIVAPWGEPVEERPPILSLEETKEGEKMKRDAKIERRAARRREGRKEGGRGATLTERHTDVVGGPEVMGGEARVVLERETGEQ
ncbi:MAG: hypothetical protein Q9181_003783 [Wetmoreana brouardii]